MIDAHTHIHDEQFDIDREEVIRRAFDSGVEKMLAVGTNITESGKTTQLADRYKNIWATVGIHPEEFMKHERNEDLWMKQLEELARHPNVVAIGEVGLDYYTCGKGPIRESQKEAQKKGFIAQMELARDRHLPLVIHTRASSLDSDDAYRDLLEIFLGWTEIEKQKCVLHCYQGDVEVTGEFLKFPNVIFSFAGNVTYPVKKSLKETKWDIRKTIRLVPMNRILTETDCPYLAPQSVRGKRNEPAFVQYVEDEIARIKGISVKSVGAEVGDVFKKIFL